MKKTILYLTSLLVFVLSVLLPLNVLAQGENVVVDINLDGDYLWLSTHGGLIRFNKNTETWISLYPPEGGSGPLIYNTAYTAARNEGGLYVAMAYGGLWVYDTDQWTKETNIEETTIRQVEYDRQGTLWALGFHHFYKHTGDGWEAITISKGESGSSGGTYTFGFESDGTVWISGGWGVSKYSEGNFEHVFADIMKPNRLIVDDDDRIWIARADTLFETDGSIWHSYNATNSNYPGGTIQSFNIDNTGTLWAGGLHWIGSFDGSSWAVYDSTDCSVLRDTAVWDIVFDPDDILWLGTSGNGLLKFDGSTWTHYNLETGEITAVEEPSDTPSSIDLLPAYPNPFNPQTTIAYVLPEAADVTLSVYSVTGQQVAVLADEYMGAGYHSAVFNGEGLASGVYFCRLDAEGRTLTQKLTLVK